MSDNQMVRKVLCEYLVGLPGAKVEAIGTALVFCRNGYRTTLVVEGGDVSVVEGGDVSVVGTVHHSGDRYVREARFPLADPDCFERVTAEARRQAAEINWDRVSAE